MWVIQTLTSFLSQAIVAAYFGAGESLDAYVVGTTIPTTLYMIVSATLSTATIVYINQLKTREGDATARKKIGGLMIGLLTISVCTMILVFLLATDLINLIAPGLIQQVHQKAVACLRITVLSIPFLTLFSLMTGLLQAEGRFYVTSLSSIFFVGLVPLPILLSQDPSAETLAWGFNLSAMTSCILLFAVSISNQLIKTGRLEWSEFKHAIALSMPVLVAAFFTHTVWIFERYFASSLPPGAISALSYGQRVLNFVAGGLTFATSTTLLSDLSSCLRNGDTSQAARLNCQIMQVTNICAVVGVVSILVGGEWIVRVAFARGQFDESAIALTTTSLHLYLGMFVAYLYTVVLARSALAVGGGAVMVTSTAVLLASYLVLTPVLLRLFSFRGLALSASLAWLLSAFVYFLFMKRRYPFLYSTQEDESTPVRTVSKPCAE
jgi:putative peptidoglycan lipid II flippase